MTVTRMDTGGAVLGTLTGVVRVYRGGRVESFTDPATVVDGEPHTDNLDAVVRER